MLQELLDLGIDLIELNVHTSEETIQEALKMKESGLLRFSSLHNYCPTPTGAKHRLSLSSPDEDEREEAVKFAKITVDWARRLDAYAVVLHMGNPPMENLSGDVLELLQQGRQAEADAILAIDMNLRDSLIEEYMDATIKTLVELGDYAEAAGIKLGVETRYSYHEIPTFEEFKRIFAEVSSPAVGYWHDTGHGNVHEIIGFASQEEWLGTFHDRLVGMHVHDGLFYGDHRAIGKGNIDFSRIVPFIKPDTQLVLEIHDSASPEELLESRDCLARLIEEA